MSPPNQVVCPECGKVRLERSAAQRVHPFETPPGTTVLPTVGMARKASGAAGRCACGKRDLPEHDEPREG